MIRPSTIDHQPSTINHRPSTLRIGIFDVTELSPGRWKALNTLTTFEHVTYGTVEDVQLVLEKQSEDWERRFADNAARKPGKRAQENWAPRRTLAPLKRTPIITKESP